MTTRQYRDKHEIMADMLRTIIESGIRGASKTIIMYKSFLSFAQLKEYLLFLLDKGLVEEYHHQRKEDDNKRGITSTSGDDHKYYKITEKGRRLLVIFEEINSLIDATSGNVSI